MSFGFLPLDWSDSTKVVSFKAHHGLKMPSKPIKPQKSSGNGGAFLEVFHILAKVSL